MTIQTILLAATGERLLVPIEDWKASLIVLAVLAALYAPLAARVLLSGCRRRLQSNQRHITTMSDRTNGTTDSTDVEDELPPGFEPGFDVEDTKQEQGVQIVTVPGLGEAAVYYADFETMRQAQNSSGAAGRGGEAVLSPRAIAKILREKYVSPSFEHVTRDDVKKMKPTKPPQLLNALANDDVDIDMNADGSAAISAADGDDDADAEDPEAGGAEGNPA